MALTSKDLIATALAGAVFGIGYLHFKGSDLPVLTNPRLAATVLGLMGIGMCIAASSSELPTDSPLMTIGAILGGLVMFLLLATIVTGNKYLLLTSCAVILLMWAGATIRHLVTK